MLSFGYRRSPQLAQYLEENINAPLSVVTVVPDGLPLVLEGSSLTIFQRIDAASSGRWKTAAEISVEIADDLEMNFAQVHESVADFLTALHDAQLIERREHPYLL